MRVARLRFRPEWRWPATSRELESTVDTKHPALTWGAVAVGAALIILAIVYWIEPVSKVFRF